MLLDDRHIELLRAQKCFGCHQTSWSGPDDADTLHNLGGWVEICVQSNRRRLVCWQDGREQGKKLTNFESRFEAALAHHRVRTHRLKR